MIYVAANATTTLQRWLQKRLAMLLNGANHPQIAPFLGGSGPPSNRWYLGTTRVIKPNGISIGSAVFVWVSNAMLYNALSEGMKTPKIAAFPWDCSTPPEKVQATAISNMHKQVVSHVRFGRYARRHTHTHTHTRTHTDVLITILCHRSCE